MLYSGQSFGKVHGECRAFKENIPRNIPQKKPHVGPDLLFRGFQQFQEEAKETFEESSNQVEHIKDSLDLITRRQ